MLKLAVFAVLVVLTFAQPPVPILDYSYYANVTVSITVPQNIEISALQYYDYNQKASRVVATIPGVPQATLILRYGDKKAYAVVLGRCLLTRDLTATQLPPDILRVLDSVRYIGVENFGGRNVDHWQATDEAVGGVPIDFYFNQNTNVPFRIALTTPELAAAIQFVSYSAQANDPSLFTPPRGCPATENYKPYARRANPLTQLLDVIPLFRL